MGDKKKRWTITAKREVMKRKRRRKKKVLQGNGSSLDGWWMREGVGQGEDEKLNVGRRKNLVWTSITSFTIVWAVPNVLK